jgi:hypothetical protein
MRPLRIARATGVFAGAAHRTRQDRLLDGVPGSGRGSVAFGVAIVALTTRFHPHGTSNGTFSVTGLILAAVVIVIFFIVRLTRNRRN